MEIDEKKEIEILESGVPQSEQSNSLIIHPDYLWMQKLLTLQKENIQIHYQLAYYSTIGGAYSVCHHPKQALFIAKHQEFLGRKIHAINVIIRAKLYQYINLTLLGSKKRSKLAYNEALTLAQNNNRQDMLIFCDTILQWMKNHQMTSNKNADNQLTCIKIEELPQIAL